MARVDSPHNHIWRLRLEFLKAARQITPKVFQSLRDGLPKLGSPYAKVAEAYAVHRYLDIDFKQHGRWELWPPAVWARTPFEKTTHAIKAIDQWAEHWHMGHDDTQTVFLNGREKVQRLNWFKGYALRLCAYWCDEPEKREALELVGVQDLDLGLGLDLPPLPSSLPLWFPGGVWLPNPEQYTQRIPDILREMPPAEPGEEILIPIPEDIHATTPAEYLEVVERWTKVTDGIAKELGWEEVLQKRNLKHFDWLALRFFGAAGPKQIVKLTKTHRNVNSVQEAVTSLAQQMNLPLPSPGRAKRLTQIVSKVGFSYTSKRKPLHSSSQDSPDTQTPE